MQQWLKETVREVRQARVGGQQLVISTLEFHPGLTCPLSCNFCHTTRNSGSIYGGARRQNALSGEDIQSIIKEFVSLGGRRFVLSGGLEPFMSDLSTQAICCARGAGLRTAVYTSGLGKFINDATLPVVVESADRLRFSISAGTARTYRAIQVPNMSSAGAGLAFARVRRLIATAVGLSRRYGTQVGVQYLLQQGNTNEWESALDFAARVGVAFFELRCDIMSEDTEEPSSIQMLERRVAEAQKEFPSVQVEFRRSTRDLTQPKRCHVWKSALVIDAFGGVHACCLVADRPAEIEPFGFGYVRCGSELRSCLEKILNDGRQITQCSVCADRTRVFNGLFEGVAIDSAFVELE